MNDLPSIIHELQGLAGFDVHYINLLQVSHKSTLPVYPYRMVSTHVHHEYALKNM